MARQFTRTFENAQARTPQAHLHQGSVPWPKGRSHEHTFQSASDVLEAAITRNMERFECPRSAAVRKALPFGETLRAQVTDPTERARFEGHLESLRLNNPPPLREYGPPAKAALTLAAAKARFAASIPDGMRAIAQELLRAETCWDVIEAKAIEDEIVQSVASAERLKLLAAGATLEDAQARAQAEAIRFVATSRKNIATVRNRGKRVVQVAPRAARRQQRGVGGGFRPPIPDGPAERKDDGPKIVETKALSPSEAEERALAKKLARIEKQRKAELARKSPTFGEQQRFAIKAATTAAPAKKGKRR